MTPSIDSGSTPTISLACLSSSRSFSWCAPAIRRGSRRSMETQSFPMSHRVLRDVVIQLPEPGLLFLDRQGRRPARVQVEHTDGGETLGQVATWQPRYEFS